VRSFVILVLASSLFLTAGCSEPIHREIKVGRLHRAYVDTVRTNWQGDGARPITATVWYPASLNSIESEWSVGVFRFGHSALDAPFADTGRYPLVVISHGTGGSAAQLSWLAERLVNAGFIVAGVNHHGNTAAEDIKSPPGFVLPEERARDLTVLIDHLLADHELAPHIDPQRIGAAGFSLGGYTALAVAGAHLTFTDWQGRCKNAVDNPVCMLPPEAGFSIEDVRTLAERSVAFKAGLARGQQPVNDARIRAAYAIAPALVSLLEKQDISAIQVPVKVVLAEQDEQILLSKTAEVIARDLPNAEIIRIPYAGHYAFLAPCNFRGKIFLGALCRDSNRIDRSELHDRVGRDAARFFKANL